MATETIEEALRGRENQPDQLIEVVQDIQEKEGYISQDAMLTETRSADNLIASAAVGKGKRPLSSTDNGSRKSGRRDLSQIPRGNPRPLDPQSEAYETQAALGNSVAACNPDACTSACTGNGENVHKTPAEETAKRSEKDSEQSSLEALAQAMANLSADDRAKLAVLLGRKE